MSRVATSLDNVAQSIFDIFDNEKNVKLKDTIQKEEFDDALTLGKP